MGVLGVKGHQPLPLCLQWPARALCLNAKWFMCTYVWVWVGFWLLPPYTQIAAILQHRRPFSVPLFIYFEHINDIIKPPGCVSFRAFQAQRRSGTAALPTPLSPMTCAVPQHKFPNASSWPCSGTINVKNPMTSSYQCVIKPIRLQGAVPQTKGCMLFNTAASGTLYIHDFLNFVLFKQSASF